MNDEAPPVPDLLSQRTMAQDDDGPAGPPGQSGLSFDDAIGMHQDLRTKFEEAKATFEEMSKLNEELGSASQQGIVVPNGPENLYRVQAKFARHLDSFLSLLESEKDQLRVEILRTIYSNLVPYWQSLMLQLHMMRAQAKHPGRVHEQLLAEATAMYDRSRARI